MSQAPLPGEPGFVFAPQSPEFDRDPYPMLRAMREHAPVYWWELPKLWVLTRHEDVMTVLADEARFSPDIRYWDGYVPPPAEHADHPVIKIRESSMLTHEGAEHTRLRKLASSALTRRAVRGFDSLMTTLIDELIDRVAARGECEFVSEIAAVYPVGVVSRLLGIPASSDRERRFKGLADAAVTAFSPVADPAGKLRAIHATALHLEEVRGLMEEKRRNPADDLMSYLLQVEEAGDRFTADEVVSLIMTILIAGSETTANSLAFGLLALLRHPEQYALFRDDPSVRENAAYEIIRYEQPGRFLNRAAKCDAEIRGEKIRKGQMLLCSVASAQRDAALFDDPDRFDITRVHKDSSAFGIGRHFCLGAQLARLELEIGLGRIVERLPKLRLADPAAEIAYRSSPVIRGPAALPVLFDPS